MSARKYTIAEIKAANKQLGPGLFFARETMRHFNTKIESEVIQGPGGIYFITSDRYDSTAPKTYKVRKFLPETGRVFTAPEMTETPYETLSEARTLATHLAALTASVPA